MAAVRLAYKAESAADMVPCGEFLHHSICTLQVDLGPSQQGTFGVLLSYAGPYPGTERPI